MIAAARLPLRSDPAPLHHLAGVACVVVRPIKIQMASPPELQRFALSLTLVLPSRTYSKPTLDVVVVQLPGEGYPLARQVDQSCGCKATLAASMLLLINPQMWSFMLDPDRAMPGQWCS
ncbi:hypothetical protein [Metapseudomonas boanensis]|uniref:Uncharacterized protein n=1 Tax=Metapseudomonas boanensis TaxID=2822138 RepID=A0ABS5XBI6_9GAMM|nr:hypothetical protein [Pseudomonas boanensis]MBT8765049.1 hypothetical protein [Pseudomonas boanensis]